MIVYLSAFSGVNLPTDCRRSVELQAAYLRLHCTTWRISMSTSRVVLHRTEFSFSEAERGS